MEKEKQKCFNQEGKLNSLIFEGREVSMARIMMTANPVKLIATKDAVYYADGKPSSLTDIEIFELKNNVKQAIAIFNALLAGSFPS